MKIPRRLAALLLTLTLLLPLAAVSAEDDEDFLLADDGLLVEEYLDSDLPWDFPVALSDIDPELIRLANRENLLPKDFVPGDLTLVPKDPAKGGIRWAVTPTDGKLKGQYLRAPAAEALCRMNAAMREVDGFRDMYLKSAYRSYGKQKTMCHNRLAKNNGKDDGCCKGNVFGTYLHGLFDTGELTEALIRWLAQNKGLDPGEMEIIPHEIYVQQQYDILADGVRKVLDMDKIYEIMDRYEISEE